jgi:flagellar hook protein FlgE
VSLGAAGSGGRGVIQDQSLEGSNVDISTEFANLIVAQNAFDANSKSVTTFDTVDQDTLNMMR